MDSLSKLNQVAHILRHRLSNGEASARKPEGKPSSPQTSANTPQEVVNQKIQQLKAAGAQGRALNRAAVAAILQAEFGDDALVLDADYQHMVDLVCDAIESDPELLGHLTSLLKAS